jgi:hypothetical protein
MPIHHLDDLFLSLRISEVVIRVLEVDIALLEKLLGFPAPGAGR